jgi:N-acetylglucosamine-6-phosphate deacetylase
MPQPIKIFNGKVITPARIIEGGCIIVSGDTITSVCDYDIMVANAIEIDAGGNYISPGFIDLHVHGGGGQDFMDGNEQAFLDIAAIHARHGTTAMLPTTLTSTKEAMIRTLEVYEDAHRNNSSGSQFLGMHLEGPYFAMNQRGAQDPRYIRDPDPAEYQEIMARSTAIRRWSVAPELAGAIEMGTYLRSKMCCPQWHIPMQFTRMWWKLTLTATR